MSNTLMAKSLKKDQLCEEPPYSATLLGHTKQCIDVANLFNEYATASMVLACGSEEKEHVDWFQKALLLAVALHDIGKSTDAFQSQLVSKGRATPHYVRHEVISYWIMSKDSGVKHAIQQYFASDQARLIPLVEGAVLSHHLKFPRQSTAMKSGGRYYQGPIKLLGNRLRNSGMMDILGSIFGSVPTLATLEPIVGTEDWLKREVQKPFKRSVNERSYTDVEQMLGSMLRGALISVDTIGSLQFETIDSWSECLELFRKSWRARLKLPQTFKDIVDEQLKGKQHHASINDFQENVANAETDVVVVEAGCGLGKTVATFKRAANVESRGLFLTFPTTSVASQVFEEYAHRDGVESQLLHGRSAVDMEFFYPPTTSEDDPGDSNNELPAEIEESLRRLMSPITFCTVDTVLGVLQMRRSSLCLLPILCQSMIVFDEVHSFSPKLFKHLLAFCRYFHVPMVMMTATLPPAHRMALQNALVDKAVAWIQGPADIESKDRYRVRVASESTSDMLSDEVVASIREAVYARQKVLVVFNQVNWTRTIFEQLIAIPEFEHVTHLLHSRFKYLDRRQIQRELVDLFRKKEDALIAVTTQICEISFDISADLLISNVAPFPAMVQRLGRLNRGASPSERLATAIFVPFLNGAPYNDDELATGVEFVNYVQNQSEVRMSQLGLNNWLNQSSGVAIQEQAKVKFTWFDEGVGTLGDSLRESGYTMDIILQTDFNRSAKPTDKLKFVLPLPLRAGQGIGAKRWRHYSIVDDAEVEYCHRTGGDWKHG